jgi:hypothetical protein
MTLSANAAFGSWIKNHDEDSEGFWRQDFVFLFSFAEYPVACCGDEGEENPP